MPTFELEHISKHFGATVALDDVSLRLSPGERLALVGENGAGKSTLMSVLYGLYPPDRGGVLRVDGTPLTLRSPKDALARGIGMVHQHFTLVPTLTVTENVVLGAEPTRGPWLDRARARAEVKASCERFGFAVDPDARVGSLTVGSQQKVEILKALHRGAQTLILDEPTAVLTPQEAQELFAVARALSDEGRTVVLISHKLRDVLAFATRIAVLRRGKKVGEVAPQDTTAEALAELMIGGPGPARAAGEPNAYAATSTGDAAASGATRSAAPEAQSGSARSAAGGNALDEAARSAGGANALDAPMRSAAGGNALDAPTRSAVGVPARAPALQLTEVRATGLKGVTLTAYPGEILGIAGVDGNGQRELAEVPTGLRPFTGEYVLQGKPRTALTPADAQRAGVAHIPEDRLARAIITDLTVEENVALGRHQEPPFAKGLRIDFEGRRARALALVTANDVRPPEPTARMGDLSGGNQQKLVVARELDRRPKVLVAVQPTRGLDLLALAAVHARLRAEAERGCAVVLISLDLDEVLALAHRVLVLFDGKVNGEFPRAQADERTLGRRMLGTAP